MTQTQNEPTPEAADEEPTAADEGTTPADDASDEESGDREAAKYRRRLRQTERDLEAMRAERDELREKHLNYVLDVEVRKAAAGKLADPEDLLVFVPRDQLLGEDGMPSAERIASAVFDLTQRRPHLAAARVVTDFDAGARPEGPSGRGWDELIQRR